MSQTKELYFEVVRLFKEGYSYRKIETLLKERFGVSYRTIGNLVTSYKVAREVEGDFFEVEREAKEIREKAQREAAEKEEKAENLFTEKLKEARELDEMIKGSRKVVEDMKREYHELRSELEQLRGQKNLLLQTVKQQERAIESLEERNRLEERAYDSLKQQNKMLENKIQNTPSHLWSLSHLSSKEIANLLLSLPQDKLIIVLERLKEKKTTPPPLLTLL